MEVSQFRFVGLDDPIQIVLGIGGVGILALGALMAGPLRRPAGRRLILMGLAFVATAVIYTLIQGWLAPTA